MEVREIIISVEQLNLIKELIKFTDLSHFKQEDKEELELISGMIEDIIESKEDIVHGMCY